ncbi:MAG TPA: inositol monophosphatase family protein [Candidatus Saccharimonadales bacterium]|nr:inositol monophosphatase family protein [Candidatus Saccharimonadales bacterium]
MSLEDDFQSARRIIAEANSVLAEAFYSPGALVISNKSDGTKVTNLDQLISDFVVKYCWHYGRTLLSEENGSTAVYGQDGMFILDPVDGTHNLIEAKELNLGVSLAGVSLGLWLQSPVMGVVGFPLLGSPPATYMAYKDGGAWREYAGEFNRLEIDTRPTRGVVFVTTSQSQSVDRFIATLRDMGFTPFRTDGAVFKACALVDPALPELYRHPTFAMPEGPVVGFVSRRVHLHDVAAVTCIVREAGGVATEPKNAEGKQVWAAANNPEVHSLLMEAATIS